MLFTEWPAEFHEAPRLVMAANCVDTRAFLTTQSWIIDSGATVTIVSHIHLLAAIDTIIAPIAIKTMNGVMVKSAAAGPCVIRVIDPHTRVCRTINLPMAYYVPGAEFNLFTVQAAQSHGLAVHFDTLAAGYYGSVRQGTDLADIMCLIQQVGGALCLTCPDSSMAPVTDEVACASNVSPSSPYNFSSADLATLIQHRNAQGGKSVKWSLTDVHRKLGHRHPADILKMADNGLLPRIELTSRRIETCHACSVGNLNFHNTVPRHHHRATRPQERLYADFFIPGRHGGGSISAY
jgi:hypothetical protein